MSTVVIPGRMFQTYSLVRPAGRQYWRTITCEQAQCPRWRNGWRTVLNMTVAGDVRTARWIEKSSRRAFTHTLAGSILTFEFSAGQQCFDRHQEAVEREPLYVVRGGQVGRLGPLVRKHARGEDWRDDMGELLTKVSEERARG